ncbi:hypothetical protein [Hymenobacter tenuis]
MNEITEFSQIQDGDTLTVKGLFKGRDIHTFHNVKKKETEVDGREVILRRRDNVYFNFDLYQAGTSWVKAVWKL